jgi:hypothetical protein
MRYNMDMYYVYAYLREDGTPYYIGKGCRNRMNAKFHPGIGLPPENRRTKLYTNLTNEEACDKERDTIKKWGRKDLGTGILYNRTDGGDDPPRMTKNNPKHRAGVQNFWDNLSVEERRERAKKISETKKGRGNNLPTKPVMINELNMSFPSITECANYINGDVSTISRCLNGRSQTRHRGYTFSRV